MDKWWFGQVYGLVDTVTNLAMLWYGALPWLWDRSGDVLALAGWSSAGSEVQAATPRAEADRHLPCTASPCRTAFLLAVCMRPLSPLHGIRAARHIDWVYVPPGPDGSRAPFSHTCALLLQIAQTIVLVLLSSAFSVVTEAPWSLFSTFVIEERHGFNKQTLGLWVADQLKAVALGLVFIPPIVGGLTMIMQISGPYVALYLWAFTCGLSVFMMTVRCMAAAVDHARASACLRPLRLLPNNPISSTPNLSTEAAHHAPASRLPDLPRRHRAALQQV